MTPQLRSAITPSAWRLMYARIVEIDDLFQSSADEVGKIDVLFVNAGVGELTHLADMTERVYDAVFAINTKDEYFTMQKALPFLNDGASIIFNGLAPVSPAWRRPGTTVYADIQGRTPFSRSDGSGRARRQGHSGQYRKSRSYPYADLRSFRPAR